MASRKEYEMLFKLNAQLGSSYNSTFSRAQSEFVKLGNEIQSLSKIQSDISAYQKQQSAIESTGSKLQNLRQQHDLLQKEIAETEGSTTNLEREKAKLEQRIRDTESSLERQKNKLGETNSRLKEAGINTNNLAAESARLSTEITSLRNRQDDAANSANTFGETASVAFEAVSQAIAAAGIAEALGEIYDAYMECVNVAGEFEASMSNVEALSGATGAEMENLSAKAKQLGADTVYSAKEAADAMGYMGMAGWSASEMLAGMDGVLSLAAASGEDLAMVSDIVTDSMTAFGLTAADTSRYADVLAAAATKSNTSVALMGETFKYAAPVAGTLGYSVEDVSVAIGLMANAGIKSSQAGTALRNIFNGLLEGATLTADAFGEYEYSAVKADGTMRTFSETISDLRYYFDQMTEAEQAANAETIAGMYGYSGLLAIMNATDEEYASLSQSINECTGAAERMAAIKLDNLQGDLELMNGAWDALKTTIGEQFIPEMRTIYSVGDDVFTQMDEFVQKNPELVKAAAAFAGVIGVGVAGLTAFATATKVVIPLMGMLTASIPGVNVIAGVTAAVAGVTAAVVGLTSAANEGIPSVRELTDAARDMQDTMDEAQALYEDTASATVAAANVADIYITKLEEMGDYVALSNEEQEQYRNTLTLLTQVVPDLAQYIDTTTGAIQGGTDALRANTEAWKQNAMQQALQEQLTTMYSNYSAVLIEAEENSLGLTKAQTQLDAANKKLADTYDRMDELVLQAKDDQQAYYEQYGKWVEYTAFLGEEYSDLENSIADTEDEINRAEKTVDRYTEAIEADAEAVAEAESAMDSGAEAVMSLTGALSEGAGMADAEAQQLQTLESVISSVTTEMQALADAYYEAYTAAYESVSGQYAIWDEAADVVVTRASEINTALEGQATYWHNYNTNLQSLVERTGEIEGLSDLIASFADGSADSVNAIAGMAKASDEDLKEMVKNWQEVQAEWDAVSESIGLLETDLLGTMDDMQTELLADVEGMDLSYEAAQSAANTMQSYIDTISGMLPEVNAAYADFSDTVRLALYNSVGTPYGVANDVDLNAYASGTMNAAPGVALVGEEGPELVRFRGGEQVVPAAQTAAILGGYGGEISLVISPTYRFEGGAPGGEQLQEILDRNNETIRDLVLDAIQEAGIDAARRAYA